MLKRLVNWRKKLRLRLASIRLSLKFWRKQNSLLSKKKTCNLWMKVCCRKSGADPVRVISKLDIYSKWSLRDRLSKISETFRFQEKMQCKIRYKTCGILPKKKCLLEWPETGSTQEMEPWIWYQVRRLAERKPSKTLKSKLSQKCKNLWIKK